MARTTTAAKPTQQNEQPRQQNAVALVPPRLAFPDEIREAFEIDQHQWRALTDSVFPLAKQPASIAMALAYCKQRKLDVFKRVVHVVGTYAGGKYVETVWPGIAEVRTTAARTGQYAGLDMPTFGPMVTRTFKGKENKGDFHNPDWQAYEVEVTFPAWCQITVYRVVHGTRCAFPGPRVEWMEFYSRKNRFFEAPNERWIKSPTQMLEKCAEAAALRRAFPEEVGDEWTAEEAGGLAAEPIDITGDGMATVGPAEPKRSDYQPAQQEPEKPTDAPGQQAPAQDPPKKDAPAPIQQRPPVEDDKLEIPAALDRRRTRNTAPAPKPQVDDVDPETGEIKEEAPKPAPAPESEEDGDDIPFGDDPPAATEPAAAKEYPPEYWLPDRPLKFGPFNKAGLFGDWSEPFLDATNPEGARQWLRYYGMTLAGLERGRPEMVKMARNLRAQAEAKIKQPDDPPLS